MPIGGKLVLKGGETLAPKGVEKKKKKKQKSVGGDEVAAATGGDLAGPSATGDAAAEATAAADPKKAKPVEPSAINVMSGKRYEEEFEFETKRVAEGKTRSTPWGSTYRAPPPILHGYTSKVTGKNAQERLDLRCASKTDKFCK